MIEILMAFCVGLISGWILGRLEADHDVCRQAKKEEDEHRAWMESKGMTYD